MEQLISIRSNIFYSKSEKEEYTRFYELIFLLDKADYIRTNDGDIVRQRKIKEQRFIISSEILGELIKTLTRFQEVDEAELI